MERLQRQMKVDPIPEDGSPYRIPGFLEKTNSMTSTGSDTQTPNTPKDRPNGNILSQLASSGMQAQRDEGLGESLDQNSEAADSHSSPRGQNGLPKNCDTVPEEVGDSPSKKSELTLDPSKLETGETEGVSPNDPDTPGDDGPFSHKVGSIKKVSFFCGEETGGDNTPETPVSETYVYEGKPKKKFGFLRK